MKALKLIVFGIVLFFASTLQSQVSVNVNIGTPPLWGPAGYTDVRYYYLPDVEAYYDVRTSMFIYLGGGRWIHRSYLPSHHRNYDLYGGYKVVMRDYRGNTPYTHFKEHKGKYRKGYHGDAQRTIGHRPGRHNNPKMRSNGGQQHRDYKPAGNGRSGGHGNDKNSNRGRGKGNDHGGGKGKK